jgi:uncharacterized protein (TIGR02466 family)
MSHLDLFAIPLYRTIIGAPTQQEQDHLSRLEMTEGRHTALNSHNLRILDQIQLRELRHKIDEGIGEFMTHLGVDQAKITMPITTSWLNLYQQGDSTHQHSHSNSIISGVYYLEDCDHTAPIQFHRAPGYVNLWPNTINLPIKQHNALNIDVITVIPKKGELIMWPSHLAHSVPPNESDTPRHTIAFNTFVKGTLDPQGGSELTI